MTKPTPTTPATPQPSRTTPWPTPVPASPTPRHPRYTPCCELAQAGDRCSCRAWRRKARRAPRTRPIVLDLRRAA